MRQDLSPILKNFTYNADGIRIGKNVDGIQHDYIVSGSQIFAETWTLNGVEHFLHYVYDESGAPIGLNYRNNQYAANVFDVFYFEKNLQGDIVAIYNDSGTRIGTYTYDAWGNFTVSTTSGITSLENSIVRSYNPFRYRGYYYDTDLAMYYLQSRYYNPQWGRFLNADGYVNANGDLIGYNMFAYCSNNPVMYSDPSGESILGVIGLCLLGGGLLLGLTSSESTKNETEVDYNIYKKEINNVEAAVIQIEDSHKIGFTASKKEILTQIITSEEGKKAGLKEDDIDYYVKEWNVHNVAYNCPWIAEKVLGWDKEEVLRRSSPVDLNTNDENSKCFEKWGWWCGFFG